MCDPEAGRRRPAATDAVVAIDASTDCCGIAVARGPDVLYEVSIAAPRRHSEVLHPAIARAFQDLWWKPSEAGPDLLGIAVTVGPGSFTGLRIGIAAATGLACAWGLPVAGISSLAVLAAAAATRGNPGAVAPPAGDGPWAVAAGIGTRTGDCYAALFKPVPGPERARQIGGIITDSPDRALDQVQKVAAGRFRTILLSGDAWPPAGAGRRGGGCVRLVDCQIGCPPPGVLALLGWETLSRGKGVEPEAVRPVYVRRSGAS